MKQLKLDHFIRSKTPYARLTSSRSGRLESLKKQNRLTADVVVFARDGEHLETFLCRLSSRVKNAQQIIVFTPERRFFNPNDNTDSITHTYPIQEFSNVIRTLKADYVLFLDDTKTPPSVDITDALTWLEKTHAHAFYCHLDTKSFSSRSDLQKLITVQISLEDGHPDTTYAWQYQDSIPGLTPLGALVRKEDLNVITATNELLTLEQLNDVWTAQLNKEHVGLFYRGS